MDITINHDPLRQPFTVECLPLVARLYRSAFRSGQRNVAEPVKFMSRLAFYAARALHLGSSKGSVRVDIGGIARIARFDARNRQYQSLYFDKFRVAYEPEVSTLIDLLVPDDGVFFDIGANWGYHAVRLAARPGFAGAIHAFEPWPSTFHDLQDIVAQLALNDVVTCYDEAVGSNSGSAQMTCGSHSGLAKLTDSGSGKTVAVRKLDDLNLDLPDLIKVDVESREADVFAGACELFRRTRPMIVFEYRITRLTGRDDQTCLQVLEDLGYKLFSPQSLRWSEHHKPTKLRLTAIDRDNPNSQLTSTLFACHQDRIGEVATLSQQSQAA